MPQKSDQKTPPLVVCVYESLKERIGRGDYLPGVRLVENELTQEYQVSRVTIREALRRLAADETVELMPHVGVRVRRLKREDVVEIYAVREPLEGLAARLAAKAKPDEKAGLFAIHEAIGRCITTEDVVGFARVNAELHTRIAEMTGNRTLVKVLNRLHMQLTGYQFVRGFSNENRQRAHGEHAKVITHIVEGNAEAAERAMKRHLRESRDSILPIVGEKAMHRLSA